MSKKVWYNYWQPPYVANVPRYHDSSEFSWTAEPIRNFDQIKKELMKLIEDRDGRLIGHYSDQVNDSAEDWNTLAFKQWGIKVKRNLNEVPYIKEWLSRQPYILSASVNILNHGASINPHQGDTNAILRCHMGVEISGGLPELGFEVNGEPRCWEEGDFLIFRDAYEHRAWNNSGRRRVIFVVDYLLDEYRSQKTAISINVRSFQVLQWVVSKWSAIKKWPKWMHRVLFFMVRILLYILWPIQQITGVLKKHS